MIGRFVRSLSDANSPFVRLFSMSTTSKKMTAGQFLVQAEDGIRYELIDGVLHKMTPAGFEHGRIAMRLGSLLEQHVRAHGLGVVCAAETGFLLSKDPDTVLAPDVAFVRQRHVEQLARVSGYADLAPDLVAEVISPSDRYTDEVIDNMTV